MRVRLVPVLSDNYSYLLIDEASATAAVVDPAEAEPVLAAARHEQVTLTHILCTHHHPDHVGGNAGIRAALPGIVVVAGEVDAERIPGCDQRVKPGDTVAVGGLRGQVFFTPCHTRGHIAFLFEDALFCGDTLFVAGCGRFFEGDAAQMHHALNEVFAALPAATKVFCGHEYTVSNLEFARSVEPDSAAIEAKLSWARGERTAGRPTIPSTLGEERTYNPFMRVAEPAIQRAVGATDPVDVMARLRERKNAFR